MKFNEYLENDKDAYVYATIEIRKAIDARIKWVLNHLKDIRDSKENRYWDSYKKFLLDYKNGDIKVNNFVKLYKSKDLDNDSPEAGEIDAAKFLQQLEFPNDDSWI